MERAAALKAELGLPAMSQIGIVVRDMGKAVEDDWVHVSLHGSRPALGAPEG